MDAITIVALATAIGSISINIIQALKANLKNIKCCFGSGVSFKDTPPPTVVSREATPVYTNEKDLWSNTCNHISQPVAVSVPVPVPAPVPIHKHY